MKIIGLTGGVASGKNFVAEIFKKNGAEIFDADEQVHEIFKNDKKIIAKIDKSFVGAVKSGVVDKKALGKIVFSDVKKLKILEEILHQEVRKKYQEFIKKTAADKKNKRKIVVLNIPLLLESGYYKCDKIVAVVVSPSVQKKRFLLRAKKNDSKNFIAKKDNFEKRFQQIVARQIDNSERKKKSDFIIDNGISRANTVKQVKQIYRKFNYDESSKKISI